MPTSTQKVAAAIDQAADYVQAQLPELQRQASGLQAVALAAAGPLLPQLVPQLVAQLRAGLPSDPDALDAVLNTVAEHVLALRSDPATIDTTAVELPEAA